MKLGTAGLTAVLASLLATASPAAAGTVSYDGYDVVHNQNVSISGPGVNESGGSGQILLHTAGGGYLATWCVDIFHFLSGSGTYTIGGVPSGNGTPAPTGAPLSNAVLGEIGALVNYGNAHIGDTYDVSSGTQIAIWRAEYGSSYTFVGSAAAMSTADSLLAMSLPPDYSYAVLTSMDGSRAVNDQGLVTAAPEPATLGLIGLGLAGLVLIRRKRC